MANDRMNHRARRRLRRRYLAQRLEILRAAGRIFRERGFAATGMRDVAAAADLSPANLYNYFRGKHELLFFCQDNSLDRLIAALETARCASDSAAQQLGSVIEAHLHCILDEVEGSAAHLLTSALPAHLQRRLVAKRDRYEDGIRQIIAAGVGSREFIECDPALAARAILGALNWSTRWFNPDGKLNAAEIGQEFAHYLTRGLMAKPAALRRPTPTRDTSRAAAEYVAEAAEALASVQQTSGR